MNLNIEMPESLPVAAISDPAKALHSLTTARSLAPEFILTPGEPTYTLRDLGANTLVGQQAREQFKAMEDKRFGDFLPFNYQPGSPTDGYVEGTCMCGRPIRFSRRNIRRFLQNPRSVYYSPVQTYTPAPEGVEKVSFYLCPHLQQGLASQFPAAHLQWDLMRRRLAQRGSTYPTESAGLLLEHAWFRRDTGFCSFLLDMGNCEEGQVLVHTLNGMDYTRRSYHWDEGNRRARYPACDRHPELRSRYYALRARARLTGRTFEWKSYPQFLDDICVPKDFDKDPRAWRLTWEGAPRRGYTKKNFAWVKRTPLVQPEKPWEDVQGLQAAQDALPVHALGLEIEDGFELGILVGMQLLEPSTHTTDFTELLQDSAAEIRALKSQ